MYLFLSNLMETANALSVDVLDGIVSDSPLNGVITFA